MPISINPMFPVIAAQAAAPDLVLQPGTVIDAQVLKLLANDLVRIAVANLAIEVFSEIPLQAGQTLQLAVSQSAEGIRLAVVGRNNGTPTAEATASAQDGPVSLKSAPPDPATRLPDLPTSPAIRPSFGAARATSQLTALEALAVSAAAQTAAT